MSEGISQHAGENDRMKRDEYPPIQSTRQSTRSKDCTLHYMGTRTMLGVTAIGTVMSGIAQSKFQPCLAGNSHLGSQQQCFAILHIDDSPEIERITHT
jgi:hypothetical protein